MTSPLVSVGMPVYNGERFLRQAIDSILDQTFSDFELIISDNGSTDQTKAICQEYAARDGRIKYYRSNENLGAAWNFNRVFELSQGKYFKWAASDDVCKPDFIKKCVVALDSDSSLVLSYPLTQIINGEGQVIRQYEPANLRLDEPIASKRFHDMLCLRHVCLQVFGLIHRDALEKTVLIGGYTSSDRVLLAQLALLGKFYEIPDYLFLNRTHSRRSSTLYPNRRLRNLWFDPRKSIKIVLPLWREWQGYIFVINNTSLDWSKRLSCYAHTFKWLRQNYPELKGELILASKQMMGLYPVGETT